MHDSFEPSLDIVFAVDNTVEFFVNGHSVGGYGLPLNTAFNQLHFLNADISSYIRPGYNQLKAVVQNYGGPTALLVSGEVSACFWGPGPAAPGHTSTALTETTVARLEFKNGVGTADPNDENNPCTLLLRSVRGGHPAPESWRGDMGLATNLNGPIAGTSNLSPPLTPLPETSWLDGSAGIPLAPCPIPGSPSNLWLIWSGMNWYSAEESLSTEIDLCTQQIQRTGCFPIAGSQILYASACAWDMATFMRNYDDEAGGESNGVPYDQMHMKSDAIQCDVTHSHDYSDTVTLFDVNRASQDFDLIKNEDVVHTGEGTAYAVMCWSIDYIDLDNPAAGTQTAQTHNWKLILDLADPPADIVAAIMNHLGPLDTNGLSAPIGTSTGTFAFQGIYSLSPTFAGQNGFGPCASGPPPETYKPAPLI